MFPVSSNYYYLDFCLNDGIYTFEANDLFGDGWSFNSGYTLTADTGAMELEMEEVPPSSDSQPRSVTTVFSSFFPFQVEYSNWKVYQGEKVDGWNGVGFDDAAWETKKAAEIVNGETVTTYLRKSFQLTGIDDYQVLNIRMKYAGGVVVYFNGNKVARFNLIEDFDANTESIEIHDATLFSKFHIIVPTSGVQEGTNVVAFEIHRPVGTSSSDSFVFDATGVFGVNDCSTTIDSYFYQNSTALISGSLNDILDLDPFTTAFLPAESESFIEWTVENLEGSRWNAFNMVVSSDLDLVFDLYGSLNDDDDSPIQLTNKNLQLASRTKPQVSVPVALAGFRRIRYEILRANNPNHIGAMFTSYCKTSGAVCPSVDNYPSVAEGQLSPGPCNDGFTGYSYRTCSGGVLGEVQMDKCTYKTPTSVHYRSTRYTMVMGTASTTGKPTYRNIVTRWFVDDGVVLPAGLKLDEETGEILGIPTSIMDNQAFTVFAQNPNGAASVTIEIDIRVGRCVAEGVFPTTEVGTVAMYKCSTQGSYVGTQTRGCVLGEKDGEWQKEKGFCMSVGAIVILIVVVVVVIAIVVIILMKTKGKTKAVGGVKGKSKAAGGVKGKTLTKKSATK